MTAPADNQPAENPTENPAENQDATFRFLEDPATHGGAEVKRIDTHGAAVFLAGPRVLKVKRAVKFPFLDYSTLAKRKAACEAELAVNRPYAPDIYRGVVAITRAADGRLALGGAGTPVDYAVEMARFDADDTLDHFAATQGIDDALAEALGRIVAAAHARAPETDAQAWITAFGDYIAQNEAAFREAPELFPPDRAAALTAKARAAYEHAQPLFTECARAGRIRRIHGDLHLGNIAFHKGAPVLFDAIEFDPVIASGDLLYDLAFLLMDLIERGQAQAASRVFNRYLIENRRSDDDIALALLPQFLSMRAAIRAKVTAARLATAKREDHAAIAARARAYFALAERLIAPPAPRLLAIGGLSGTGKSVLARALAADLPPAPGAVVLRSDVMRKVLAGLGETEKLPPEAYTPEAAARVYAALEARAQRILAAGHSVILDAVFAKPEERTAAEALAREARVPFDGLFLTADLDTRLARIGTRRGDASDADAAVARAQQDYDLAALAPWAVIDASGTPEETAQAARTSFGNLTTQKGAANPSS